MEVKLEFSNTPGQKQILNCPDHDIEQQSNPSGGENIVEAPRRILCVTYIQFLHTKTTATQFRYLDAKQVLHISDRTDNQLEFDLKGGIS